MNRKQRRAASRTKRPSKQPTSGPAVGTGVAELLARGRKLQQLGQSAEAEMWYRRALAMQPDPADAMNLLGIAAYQTGRCELAVELIRQAIKRNGQNAGYFSNLGTALFGQGKLDEAVSAYRQAVLIKPDYADAYCNLGSTLEQQGDLNEAIIAYRRAISIRPDYADAYSNLGVALEEQGKLNEARNAFERGIELAPGRALSYRLLGDVKRFAAGESHLVAMEKLAQDLPSLPAGEQINLLFALAKAYEDIGDHERSFCNVLQGNKLKRQQIRYRAADTRELFRRIQEIFTLDLMRDKRPVFIVGMPRSGTTLVEQILASHPNVCGAGELKFITNAVRELDGRGAEALSGVQLRQLGASYANTTSKLAPNAERIVNKLPTNLVYAGLIHLALPNARIIHTRRDPIDTCVSCFYRLFSKGNDYTYDLVELGSYYRAYEALMEHWRRVLPPKVMIEVQYEHATTDLEAEARRMVAHLGLQWDDGCLSFYETERVVRTSAQVRQPIYRSSIGRWRVHERHLGPLIRALGLRSGGELGYDPTHLTGGEPSARPVCMTKRAKR
jgi:Flp pilus assembly protein TadD